MLIKYVPAGHKGGTHVLSTSGGGSFVTTQAKELLKFARKFKLNKYDWKELKRAVRVGEPISITLESKSADEVSDSTDSEGP